MSAPNLAVATGEPWFHPIRVTRRPVRPVALEIAAAALEPVYATRTRAPASAPWIVVYRLRVKTMPVTRPLASGNAPIRPMKAPSLETTLPGMRPFVIGFVRKLAVNPLRLLPLMNVTKSPAASSVPWTVEDCALTMKVATRPIAIVCVKPESPAKQVSSLTLTNVTAFVI
jgi:hypothetical protein